MKRLYVFLILTLILFVTSATAQQTGRLTGSAVDSSGGVIPGATVTLLGPNNNTVASAKTDADGKFAIDAAPGSYALQVSAAGFDNDTEGISIAAANNRPVTVTLLIAKITQQVEVQEDAAQVTLDAANNQTALTLKEDDIQALPDDTDDLTQYLTDLAGPRAAASGGVQFIIDGFLGGQVPPKDQIKEIRINTNPYTTEYSRSGFGRIEIITKPGTGKLRGNVNFNYRTDSLNATPFAAPLKLPYNRQNIQGNISGPFIHNKLTLSLNAQRQDSYQMNTLNATTVDANGNLSKYTTPIAAPNLRQNYNARGQYALSENNTLNFNFDYQRNTRSNVGVQQTVLPERGSNSSSDNYEFQFRETAVLSGRF